MSVKGPLSSVPAASVWFILDVWTCVVMKKNKTISVHQSRLFFFLFLFFMKSLQFLAVIILPSVNENNGLHQPYSKKLINIFLG